MDLDNSIEKYRDKLRGRVWEGYNIDSDKSLQIEYNKKITSPKGEMYFDYVISSLQDMVTYPDEHLSAIEVCLMNDENYGKNPYYTGKIIDLSTNDDDEFFDLNYNDEDDDSEVKISAFQDIQIAGTYNILESNVNRTEINHIFGIESVKAHFKDRKLTLRFYKDADQNRMIPYHTLGCMIMNTKDIRMFEEYHLMDQFSVLSGVINGNTDERTFDDNGNIIYLSAEHLSDYARLEDVPYLSGTSNLSFKIDEGILPLSSPYYFNPGVNTAYPLNLIQVYDVTRIDKKYLDTVFNSKNTFIIKCDEEENVFDNIEQVEIPVIHSESDAIKAIEDYKWVKNEYDTVDMRILSYIDIVTNENTDFNAFSGEISVDDTLDYEEFEAEVNRIQERYKIEFAQIEHLSTEIDDYSQSVVLEKPDLNEFAKHLRKLLNVYVNFNKDSEDGINLYFNYLNFISTPFVRFYGSKLKIDTIDRTYLKLRPGEDGKLDIVVQFKYYSDSTHLYGYKNLKLVTYHIWNISDTKPKFLIYKESSL